MKIWLVDHALYLMSHRRPTQASFVLRCEADIILRECLSITTEINYCAINKGNILFSIQSLKYHAIQRMLSY